MIEILLVDDHKVLRKGLSLLLNSQRDCKVVADVGTAQDALDYLSQNSVDLLISDITMPGLSGIDLLRQCATDFPKVNTLVLSMHLEEEYILDAIDAGAKSYLVKDSDEETMMEAIRAAAKGEVHLTSQISRILTLALLKGKKEQKERESFQLTPREKEILKCIIDGLSNRKIGDTLHISERTVNAHRYNIMRKLDANNSADLVRIALSKNLLG